MLNKKRFRLRIIVPAFPNFNIYTFAASQTTSIGPIIVASCANKLENWDVEIIDENNLHGKFYPQTKDKKLDHIALQKERVADVIGFYGSISSTVPHLYDIAKLYKEMGCITIAGGKHIESLPNEALDNNIDVAVFHEAEYTIRELLLAFENNLSLEDIKGIAFKKDGKTFITPERELITDFDKLPPPDFSLLRYAKIKFYPINRSRGCNSKCEFCSVKEEARFCRPELLLEQIKHLVETMNAQYFFETSDHFASNREEAIIFCKLFAEYQKKINKKIKLAIQTRITDAKYPDLLNAMKEANVDTIFIGYESPIDEELLAMKKGYNSKDLVEWTNTFHKHNFYIHGMFIFGYPKKNEGQSSISLNEKVKRFKDFIYKAKIDTVQILLTIPMVGTELRERLEKENRLYPLNLIGWEFYDGQFPLFEPDDGTTPEELQSAVSKIMGKFYHFKNFLNMAKNILISFPGIVMTSSVTIFAGRVKIITEAFKLWYRKFFRNYLVRFGGHLVFKKWSKNFKKSNFLQKLSEARKQIKKGA